MEEGSPAENREDRDVIEKRNFYIKNILYQNVKEYSEHSHIIYNENHSDQCCNKKCNSMGKSSSGVCFNFFEEWNDINIFIMMIFI